MFLIVDIVSTIGGHRISRFMVVGHSEKGFYPPHVWKGRWRMRVQPLEVLLAFVMFSIAEPVLSYKFLAQRCQPDVMDQGLAHPLGAGMIRMTLLISVLRGGAV
jgi:hypothetical protein